MNKRKKSLIEDEDDSFEDTKDAMMDEAAYNSDPMAYHGVSWSDFI